MLEELRLDSAEVLGEVGVESGLFADPDNLIQDALVGRVLGHCAVRSGRRGLRAARRPRGAARLARPRGDDRGIRSRRRPRAARDRPIPQLQRRRGDPVALRGARRCHAELRDLRDRCGRRRLDLSARGRRDVQRDARTLRPGLGADPGLAAVPRPGRPQFVSRAVPRRPCASIRPTFALLFPRRWLERPSPTADASLHATVLAQAAALEAQAPPALPTQVQRLMRRLLLDEKGSIEVVARNLSMHRRTLDRHLDASGCSFRNLADSLRFEVASQLLRDTDMSISGIATSLHYGDASAFAHAFGRWAGRTPSQWRREAASTDSPSTGKRGAFAGRRLARAAPPARLPPRSPRAMRWAPAPSPNS